MDGAYIIEFCVPHFLNVYVARYGHFMGHFKFSETRFIYIKLGRTHARVRK